MRVLKTAAQVIDVLGGTTEVARLFGFDRRIVSNWKTRNFPPESYLAFTQLLESKACRASPTLWKQYVLVTCN